MSIFKRNKKGDLSLSINAIVIIILAVVILGLSLVFVRFVFTKSASMIGDLDPKFLINPPNADNVMTANPTSVMLTGKNQIKTVQLAYYNSGTKAKCVNLKHAPNPTLASGVLASTASACTAVLPKDTKAWSVLISTTADTVYQGVSNFEVRGSEPTPATGGGVTCPSTCGTVSYASADVPIFIMKES